MANPKIKDLRGREVRIQPSKDKHFIDLYLGPEKTRHRSPIVRWWAAHRVFDKLNAQKFTKRVNQVIKQLK